MIIARPRLGVLPVGMSSRDTAASAFTQGSINTGTSTAALPSASSPWDMPVTMQVPTSPMGPTGALGPTGYASIPGTAANIAYLRQQQVNDAKAIAIKKRQEAVWAAEDAASHARNAKRVGADRNLLASALDFVSKAREAATRACAAASEVGSQFNKFPDDSTLAWAQKDAQNACSEATRSASEAQAAASQTSIEPGPKDIRIQPAPVAGSRFPTGLVLIGVAGLAAFFLLRRS